MFLASFSQRPWVATLYYAIDDHFNIYFVSDPESIHCKNISKIREVSCGIADSSQKVNEQKIGAQLIGTCSNIVDENEIRYALELWNKSNPGLSKIINFENFKKINAQLYVIQPRSIKFFNERLYGPEGFKIFKIKVNKQYVYKGLIDYESLQKKSLIKKFISVGYFKEKNPAGKPSYFYVHKIIAKGDTIDSATQSLSRKLKVGWYAVFWNGTIAYFIFKNKIIKLPYPWPANEFKKVTKYATSVGIEVIHFLHIKKSMENW